jgi:hypothetical protein
VTDLEITRLCAEAMGLSVREWRGPMDNQEPSLCTFHQINAETWMPQQRYDPLHDDAQTMALVKKFDLEIQHYHTDLGQVIKKYVAYPRVEVINNDLNRAICECVAKIQNAKALDHS